MKYLAKMRYRCGFDLLLLSGVFAIVLGALIAVFDPLKMIVNWKLVMVRGGETFETWQKPKALVYVKVYIFNVTNSDEYLSGRDEKLKFQEVGPYVYRENSEHHNVTFNNNDTMTITPKFWLTSAPGMSNGEEDDVLILPNIALLSFASLMSDSSMITRAAVNLLIHQTNSQPFIRLTAKEFMFGYENPLVNVGYNLMPSWIVFDKLGMVDRMYDYRGESATFFTGKDDPSISGKIDNYNMRPDLPQWPRAPCNKVSGASDGAKFQSLTPDESPMFFRKSICRGMPMVRSSNLTIRDGLQVYKYTIIDDALDNGAENPNNKCFCRKNKCLRSGLIDATDCYYGFPMVLSYPHFYKADQSLLDAIEGMNPIREKHETYFFINPLTGIPTEEYLRIQANLNLGDISHMANTDRCSNLVIPLFWVENGFDKLPDDMLVKLFLFLRVAPVLFVALQYALFVGGTAFVALAAKAAFRPSSSSPSKRAAPAEEMRPFDLSAPMDAATDQTERERLCVV